VAKFARLTDGVLAGGEPARFLALAERLPELTRAEVRDLTFTAPALPTGPKGLF
jgi:hypothetical protein